MYPLVVFGPLPIKIRDTDSRMVKNKFVYVALGVSRDDVRVALGLGTADYEGAKFWLLMTTDLKNRALQDILILVVDVAFPVMAFKRALSFRTPFAELRYLERSQKVAAELGGICCPATAD